MVSSVTRKSLWIVDCGWSLLSSIPEAMVQYRLQLLFQRFARLATGCRATG